LNISFYSAILRFWVSANYRFQAIPVACYFFKITIIPRINFIFMRDDHLASRIIYCSTTSMRDAKRAENLIKLVFFFARIF